jgi:pimeloyl-ACP methyl ester carboxylesterase
MSANTRFVQSADGVSVAYDVTGAGPALVLLHGGFVQDRRSWHDAGYVERLRDQYSVIAIDVRGHGESDRPVVKEAYEIARLIDDVEAVTDDCGVDRFLLWGFSFGGTLSLQLAAHSQRVRGAVVAGSFYGPTFSEEQLSSTVALMSRAAIAKSEGKLDELPLSKEQRSFVERADLNVAIAVSRAMSVWPVLEPGDMLCPAYLFAGSANVVATAALEKRRQSIAAAGMQLRIFEGFEHMQEFTEIETVLPPALSFLQRPERWPAQRGL